jgi:hypothetical protein
LRDANDVPAARAILENLVLGYAPSVDVVDLVSRETATDTQALKRERLVCTTC